MQSQAFWLPKHGNQDEDYEDAFSLNSDGGRFAIADGATESSFAGEWARLVTGEFAASPIRHKRNWTQWLPPVQARWTSDVGSRPLPWYAEEKFEQGAFATFLGLMLETVGCRPWHAVAIGDSCLFQIRDGQLLRAFPLAKSEDFGNSPNLLGSRMTAGEAQRREVRGHGKCLCGDRFFLATDALAQWFLREVEAEKTPWDDLDFLLGESDIQAAALTWLGELRERQEIRNDDVTLIRVTI